MQQIEEKLTNLKKEEIVNILNNIYSIANGKEIIIEELPNNIRSVVKPYIKASASKRADLIYELVESLEEIDAESDIISLAKDIKKYIYDLYFSLPLKKFNEDNLEDRLYDLDDLSEEKNIDLAAMLINFLETQEENNNANELPAIVVGLAQTFIGLNDIKKMEFLDILNRYYRRKYNNEISRVEYSIKKRQINNIFSKVNNLSPEGQREFYKEAYDEIVRIYGTIAKKERIANCDHEFGKWKDYSYTHYVDTRIDWQMCNVPVKKIVYIRKCSKCGFEERIEDKIPEEVRIERERKAKESEIKKLERQLEKLKEEN